MRTLYWIMNTVVSRASRSHVHVDMHADGNMCDTNRPPAQHTSPSLSCRSSCSRYGTYCPAFVWVWSRITCDSIMPSVIACSDSMGSSAGAGAAAAGSQLHRDRLSKHLETVFSFLTADRLHWDALERRSATRAECICALLLLCGMWTMR